MLITECFTAKYIVFYNDFSTAGYSAHACLSIIYNYNVYDYMKQNKMFKKWFYNRLRFIPLDVKYEEKLTNSSTVYIIAGRSLCINVIDKQLLDNDELCQVYCDRYSVLL